MGVLSVFRAKTPCYYPILLAEIVASNAQAQKGNSRIKCASWSEKLQEIGKNLQKLEEIDVF